MIRIVIGVAMIVAVLTIGFTLWFQTRQLTPTASSGTEPPQQYDTTGGQEMRPRWDSSGGQSVDGAGK